MKRWPHIPFEPGPDPLLPRARAFALVLLVSAAIGLGAATVDNWRAGPLPADVEQPVAP